MDEHGKYNGYTNYETWVVCLWLDNDEGSQDYLHEMALEILEENDNLIDKSRLVLMEAIKELVYDSAPELSPSLYSDLLNASLSSVDWFEIADHFLEV